MEAFVEHTGVVALMDRANVDTDQIIPKQFLKRIDRTGFGQFLFFDWRFDGEENPIADFELNRPENKGASVLVAKDNFGCGSSREHAVWALQDFGIRCVLAPDFADIFYNNCFKNGLLPIPLGREAIVKLFEAASGKECYELCVDLENQKILGEGFEIGFEIDPFRKHCLIEGLDEIGLTLQTEDSIAAYEKKHGTVS